MVFNELTTKGGGNPSAIYTTMQNTLFTPLFIRIDEIREYHPNGVLAYTENHAILNPAYAYRHDNRRKTPDGTLWIRIGECAKYHDNGLLAWRIDYNEQGDVIKSQDGYRKDGTRIMY